jgi:endonuclease/exonuclease/phosphatase family metal-dependent hydrolase
MAADGSLSRQIHLTSADGAANDLDRLHEANALTAASPEGPVALVGDFNGLSHRDTHFDADTNRYRVHEHLVTSGWNSAVPEVSTYVQQLGDDRRLGTLSFDRGYLRGLTGTATALADQGLSDHVAIRIEVTP